MKRSTPFHPEMLTRINSRHLPLQASQLHNISTDVRRWKPCCGPEGEDTKLCSDRKTQSTPEGNSKLFFKDREKYVSIVQEESKGLAEGYTASE